jgi:uncharacterized protein YndB with AHSA1/START domain
MTHEEPTNEFPESPEFSESIVVDCDLDAPPAQVWQALTEPDFVAQWLLPLDGPGEMKPRVGERFGFGPEPANGNGPIDCEVLAAEPQRLLRYSWRGKAAERDAAGRALDSVVTFTLAETEGGGTHLRIVHSGLPASRTLPGQTVMAANANGRANLRWAA